MANTYPYSSPGHLVATIEQLRKSFPAQVTADTLKKVGIASNNESYVINTLRFLELIDDEGNKKADAATAFLKGDDDFQRLFSELVKTAYADLFELHGDDAWSLSRDSLTQFFRTADHSSEVVGKRQAATFSCLAGLAGHTELPAIQATTSKTTGTRKRKSKTSKKTSSTKSTPAQPKVDVQAQTQKQSVGKGDIGLTVRIEINLPAEGDQETYDRIFKSIRTNLIDGD